MGYRKNGGRTCLEVSSLGHRLAVRHWLLNAKRYRVVVSCQPDSRSERTLKDLELSCLFYCRLNLVDHSSKVCLLLDAHGVIIMAGELYGLQQNKQLSQVLLLLKSVRKIAKCSDLPFKISSMKLLKI